eukprot:gene3281-13306_t
MAMMHMSRQMTRAIRSFGMGSPSIAPAVLLANRQQRATVRTFAKKSFAPTPEPEVQLPGEFDDDEEDYEDGGDLLDGLPSSQKRRVFALKELQEKYDNAAVDFYKEMALLQVKYQSIYTPLFDERVAIVAGTKEVGNFDVEADDEPDEGIPEFWLTALFNNEKTQSIISDRDADVLKYLTDIRSSVLTGDEHGFKLTFYFAENPYLTNATLEKTYMLEPTEDLIPVKFVGCEIDWNQGKDTTVEQVKKRVKGGKGGKAFVTETVPCDSFFKIFSPPEIPEDPSSLTEDAMMEMEDAVGMDFDVGFAVKEQVIPRAVEWFTGEIAPMDGEGEDEFYDGGDEGDGSQFDGAEDPRAMRR